VADDGEGASLIYLGLVFVHIGLV
jgi:hypothetical protein